MALSLNLIDKFNSPSSQVVQSVAGINSLTASVSVYFQALTMDNNFLYVCTFCSAMIRHSPPVPIHFITKQGTIIPRLSQRSAIC